MIRETGPRLAVFDCDGTLVDSQAGICNAMDEAFQSVGLARPDRQNVRRIVGLSLPQAIAGLLPTGAEDRAQAVGEAYRGAFRAARENGQLAEPLYDGIADALRALHAKGWLLGVATGKSDRGLAHCLATHGLSDLFVTLQTADRHPSKPHPAMLQAALDEAGAEAGNAVMIGDTAYDIAMAVSAGVRPIGVDWGYHAPADLRESGAEVVVGSSAQLLKELS